MFTRKIWHGALLAALFVLASGVAWQQAAADSVVHALSGVVKHVDKDAKTVVIRTEDGTEHTFRYSKKTVVEGARDTDRDMDKDAKDADKDTKDMAKDMDKGTKDAGKDVRKGSAEAYLAGKEGSKVTVRYTEKGAEKTAVAVKDAVD